MKNLKIELLKDQMNNFLHGKVSGQSIVDFVDEIVESDYVYNLQLPIKNNILELQDILALYVENPEKRNEYIHYYDDTELKRIISSFLNTNL